MFENHEKLNAFFDQARSRLSLVEVLVHKRNRLSQVIFGRVSSSSLQGADLNVRGSAGMIMYFDFCGADVRPYKREDPFEQGWKVSLANGDTLVFLELPQQQIAA
jgi:hypothetical protein